MRRALICLAILACLLPAGGCGTFKKLFKSKKDAQESADRGHDMFLGVVDSVNPEQKFVLVRTEMRMALAPGTKLESRSPTGAAASLVLTPERKMNFLSADIVAGSPSPGDIVILPVQPESAPAPAPAATPETDAAVDAVPQMRAPTH